MPFSFNAVNFTQKCRIGKIFEELRGGRNYLGVSMILYVVFVATELHPDKIFFQHFLVYQYVKINYYPHSLKASKKALALLK